MPFTVNGRNVLRMQGVYYTVTGLWPLVHMTSFEAITGPKTDDWLVKMVGLLAAVIGGTLFIAAGRNHASLEIRFLAIASALAFAAIDSWYSLQGRIAMVYLADAVVELLIISLLATSKWR